jgi:hypothetical protein
MGCFLCFSYYRTCDCLTWSIWESGGHSTVGPVTVRHGPLRPLRYELERIIGKSDTGLQRKQTFGEPYLFCVSLPFYLQLVFSELTTLQLVFPILSYRFKMTILSVLIFRKIDCFLYTMFLVVHCPKKICAFCFLKWSNMLVVLFPFSCFVRSKRWISIQCSPVVVLSLGTICVIHFIAENRWRVSVL